MSDVKNRLISYLEEKGISKSEFARKIGVSTAYITSIRKSISDDKIQAIKLAFPDLSIDWLLYNEGTMLKEAPTISDDPDKGKPFFDRDYALSFVEYLDSASTPDYYIKVPGYDKATLWCRTSGHSMEPEISSGDIIALQLIEDPSLLILGDIYAIETDNGMRTVKRLRRGSEPGTFRLVPSNPDYDPQEIEACRIIRVFRVLGAIKPF